MKVGISNINKDYGSWKENRTHVATIGEVIKYTDEMTTQVNALQNRMETHAKELAELHALFAALPPGVPYIWQRFGTTSRQVGGMRNRARQGQGQDTTG